MKTLQARLKAVGLLFVLAAALRCAAAAEPQEFAKQVFDATGVRGGFVVHLGCGDGHLTEALKLNDSFQVQGLDRSDKNVAAAREYLYGKGVYGNISIDLLDGAYLPYVDGMVNLLVAEDLNGISMDEVKRVLAPNGVAYVKVDNAWQKVVKPRPKEIDEWTHYFYDSRGNAVSEDTVVGPPKHLQWLGSPRWSRHHDRMSSLSAMVSSAGRLFYIMDEGSRVSILLPSKWNLIARDAFNGVILWKHPLVKWQSQLWPLKSGPTELTRRLVSQGDQVFVTLGIEEPITCLDGATGATVRTYDTTKGAEEFIVHDGVIYALVNTGQWALDEYAPKFNTGDQKRVETEYNWDAKPRELHAVDAATGKELWKKAGKIAPLTMATDGKLFVYYDGEKIVGLNPATGEQRWASVAEEHRKLFEYNYAPRLVLHDKMVLYAGGNGSMKGVDAETGKEVWTAPHNPSGYRSPEDLIVAAGLVWNAPTTFGKLSGKFAGRDPNSGEVKAEIPPDVDTYWFHHRCYIAKATEKYILTSRTGTEFIDLASKHWTINHWVRGACLYGTLPCNGFVYAGPHDCACYPEAKISGMNALAPERPDLPATPEDQRLQKGPAFDEKFDLVEPDPKDWPVYRHDNERSGFSDQPLLTNLTKSWEANLGGKLSAPVVAAGKLFVAQVDAHTLHALDATSGKELWHYIAGGRIDSPPAFAHGRVFFGSMDGHVYCLRASDGALIWRYQAAPDARHHMAFEQLESVWPVHGSVLVDGNTVNFVAGRSVFLDGGLHFCRLDIGTGKRVATQVYDNKDPETGKDLQTRIQTLQMPVGLNDILAEKGYMYLRSQKINDEGKRLEMGPVSGNPVIQGSTQRGPNVHLFAPLGFLDDTWFHRSYWVYGRNFAGGHSGYFQAGRYTPTGQILAFDYNNVYAYGRKDEYFKWTTTIEHQLSAASRDQPDIELDEKAVQAGKPGKPKPNAKEAPSGDGPYVSFPDSDLLNPAGKALTLEAWIDADQPDGVIASQGGGLNGYALEVQDRKPAFSVRANKVLAEAQAPAALSKGWHCVTGVFSATAVRLFVDGAPVAEAKAAGLIDAKPKLRLQLGACSKSPVSEYGHGKGYIGMIDQFVVFHRVLTDAEIAERAKIDENAKSGGRKPATDAVLDCIFDAGSPHDLTQNKLNGAAHDTSTTPSKFGKALVFGTPKEIPKEALQSTSSDEEDAARANEKKEPPAVATPNKQGSYVIHEWTTPISIYGRAMAICGGTVLVAGPPDMVNEETAFQALMKKDPKITEKLEQQAEALENKSGASLLCYATNGDFQQEARLECSPVWDGLVVAQGHVYYAAVDGKVVCLGKQ